MRIARKERTTRTVAVQDADESVALTRDLYTRVLMNTGVKPGTVLGITSAIDGEGKTTVALKLAVQLASDGVLANDEQRRGDILLVECNQAPSRVSQEFIVPAAPGLVQLLQRECHLDEALRATRVNRLWVLPSGGHAPTFPILIRSSLLPQLLPQLRQRFAFIILDLPSALTTTDTQVLTGLADALLLVVRSGITPAKLVRQAVEGFDRKQLVGTVLNNWQPQLPAWLENRI
jgi:receptor protein-tyrosine kinase